MKKQKTAILLMGLMLLTTFGALTTFADEEGVDEAAKGINCVLCRIANLIFMIIAALAAIVIILAGLKWLTSGDDPGARNAAKTAIVSAFVGIVIVFIAVYVVWWVVSGLPGSMFNKEEMNPTTWITGCETLCDIEASSSPTTEGSEKPGSGVSDWKTMTCMSGDACTAAGKTGGICIQDVGSSGSPAGPTSTCQASGFQPIATTSSAAAPCNNEGYTLNYCCCSSA